MASAARLAILVVLPVTAIQMVWGSEFGVYVTDVQPMKIAATEALWDTEQPAAFSLIQLGGFTVEDQTPTLEIAIPGLLSFLSTNSFQGKVVGMNPLQTRYEQQYGAGNYIPDVRLVYWSMRVMAYLGGLSLLIGLWGAWLLRRKRLADATWFQRAAVVGIALPLLSNFGGWILTEAGRQPWVAFGLQKTMDAVSPNATTFSVGLSLGVFIVLYTILGVADFWLMRRYARLDPPELDSQPARTTPYTAPGYS